MIELELPSYLRKKSSFLQVGLDERKIHSD